MTGSVEDVSDDNYESFTTAGAALVAYGIASCEPCKEYDPILEEMATRYGDLRVGKAKMHIPGRCREIKKRHNFETYPTTHLYSNGTLLLTREGKIDANDLAELIDQHFFKKD